MCGHCSTSARISWPTATSRESFISWKDVVDISPGSPGASLLPELGPAPTDVVFTRSHGIVPMGGTDLDAILRNLGVSTIVAVGVSVNIAITNLRHGRRERGVPRRRTAGCGRRHPYRLRNLDHRRHTVTARDDHHHRRPHRLVETVVTDTDIEIREFANHWHFGMVVSAAGRPDSRTAYLHVDYRKITPTDEPLVSRAWIDTVDGRKAFIRPTMADGDGNVLSEANGLMIKLLPHQP
jgi:hypothetical protein